MRNIRSTKLWESAQRTRYRKHIKEERELYYGKPLYIRYHEGKYSEDVFGYAEILYDERDEKSTEMFNQLKKDVLRTQGLRDLKFYAKSDNGYVTVAFKTIDEYFKFKSVADIDTFEDIPAYTFSHIEVECDGYSYEFYAGGIITEDNIEYCDDFNDIMEENLGCIAQVSVQSYQVPTDGESEEAPDEWANVFGDEIVKDCSLLQTDFFSFDFGEEPEGYYYDYDI